MINRKFVNYFMLVIISLWSLTSCNQNTEDLPKPVKATALKTGNIYSNSTLDVSNSKHFSEVTGEVHPGQTLWVMETGFWSGYKVQLEDGTMGWIDDQNIKPFKETFIKHNSAGNNKDIASNRGAIGADRIIVKEVIEKTAVTRLEEYRENKGNDYFIDWTKVRTKDGIEGWVMSDYLRRVVAEPYRRISRKEWQYELNSFNKSWNGETIESFINKFKEPSGINKKEGEAIYYFNNIYLFDKNEEYFGVRVYVKNKLIDKIDGGGRRTSWVSYMPLSSSMRLNLIGNYIGNWNSIFERNNNPDLESFDIRDHVPNWLYWIIVILVFLFFLAILIFVLKIPYKILNKLILKQSLNRKYFNWTIKVFAVIGSIIVGYFFYLLVAVNIFPFREYFIITTLFCLGMIIGNIRNWINDLDYNRCNAVNCHQWTGVDNGTEFLGGNTTTQTITRNDGSRETNKQTTKNYIDYRICTACGHKWSIYRTQVVGRLK